MSHHDTRDLSREDLIDLLLQLKHDLGKYIRMPIAYLPANAGDDELRAALRRALEETRRGPDGVISARELWRAFCDEGDHAVAQLPGFSDLTSTVERALSWEARLGAAGAGLDRATIDADLGAVGTAIQALIGELDEEA